MMELFSEIYGCYFSVVARILRMSHKTGLSRTALEQIVANNAFSESGFHLTSRLTSGEWDLLREKNGLYYSKLHHKDTELPLTTLQKAWLRSLLLDRRIRLFLDDAQLCETDEMLADVEPLFYPADFHTFDIAADGDNYSDMNYIRRFRTVLSAIKNLEILFMQYESGKSRRTGMYFLPQKLIYSAKDDKFRAMGLRLSGRGAKTVLLNLARIKALDEADYPLSNRSMENITRSENKRTVHIAISDERNALERCMLQFASYEKNTVYDENSMKYICFLSYDPLEETELLIRILSFGPVVEVLAPKPFLQQVRERVRLQIERMQLEE